MKDNRYIDPKTGGRMSAKETLRVFWNSWATAETMKRMRKMADDPAVTETMALDELNRVTEDCNGTAELWRAYQ
jgi:hypothetical protein